MDSIVKDEIVQFMREIQPLYDGVLGDIQRKALAEQIPIIDPETARLLGTLLSVLRPKEVLEVGCAVGFSAGLMCQYLAEGGHITTIDRYDIMIEQAKVNFALLGITDRVTLMEADAAYLLAKLEGKYDFIFLDAAKGQYLNMLPHCMRLLRVGGVLFTDDVMQSGRITRDRLEVKRRQRTTHTRMREFLHLLCHTDGLETSIIPIADGVAITHKTKDVFIGG